MPVFWMSFLEELGQDAMHWLMTRGIHIAIIIASTVVAIRLVIAALRRWEKMMVNRNGVDISERDKRVITITGILNKLLWGVGLGIAVVTILKELGIDIAPIITAAGIGGLAISFGAQNLVRDVISGFFMLVEDQIRVGDVAVLNGTAGVVEAMNLRTTVLRDLEGNVHIFPNGAVTSISNMTKEWSRSVIDVGVAYKEDVDQVIEVLKQVGEELYHDPAWQPLIIEPLNILGVDDLAASQVTIKIMITTKPLQQWTVGRELRKRIKKAFDTVGIEIPFPHTTVYWGTANKPLSVFLRMEEKDER